jgi:hypothetical protein
MFREPSSDHVLKLIFNSVKRWWVGSHALLFVMGAPFRIKQAVMEPFGVKNYMLFALSIWYWALFREPKDTRDNRGRGTGGGGNGSMCPPTFSFFKSEKSALFFWHKIVWFWSYTKVPLLPNTPSLSKCFRGLCVIIYNSLLFFFLQGTFQALDSQNRGLMSVPNFLLCFDFNKIHDSVGKALRTADQGRVTANSHAL